MLESLLVLDLDLTLTLVALPTFSLREGKFSFPLTGDFLLLLLVDEGDLNLSQKSGEFPVLVLKVSLALVDLDLCLINGEVIEEEEDMTEDCLENCPRQVLAANSKAAIEDILDILASVSTYMTASTWRENDRAWFADTGYFPCLPREERIIRSFLRSAWHPTSRRGAGGKDGAHIWIAEYRVGGEQMLKHSMITSAWTN